MTSQPTLLNLPPPPADPVTPTEVPSRSGTPNSTVTSMSELSTVAIKDGHRGHLPHAHHGHSQPPGLYTQLDAERADRISRLAGLDRVVAAGRTSAGGSAAATAAGTPPPPVTASYFDVSGNPAMGRDRSTVGSASATGSVGGPATTWAGSEPGDPDKMSDCQDLDNMDANSVGGMSDEGGAPSLVGFGEGARTPARQGVINSPAVAAGRTVSGAGAGFLPPPSAGRDAMIVDGKAYDRAAGFEATPQTLAGREEAAHTMRQNMDTTSNDRMLRGGRAAQQPGKTRFSSAT